MNKTYIRNTKLFVIAFCLFLLPFSVSAKENALRIEHSIDSKFPTEKRTFTVQLPKSYYSQTKFAYPVMYLLDGQSNLEYSDAVENYLADNALMPEVIIVAMHSGATRSRDYLPMNEQNEASGNADQFLKYMEQELLPFIDKNYRAAPLKILSGHSYGGVCVTFAMIEKPDMFQAYFAQSPFLDKTIGNPLVEHLAKFLEANPKLDSFYYMNVGDEPNLEENFKKVKELFEAKAPKSFKWNAEYNMGKSHMTTRFVGQYYALEHFFAKDWTLSQQEIISGKFAGVKKHIDDLSKKYGYPILYSEQTLAQATQIFLSTQDVPSATKTAELVTTQYPKSAIAHFFLAVSSRASGNKEKAIQAVETAIKLYEANPKEELKPLYANMKQLQQVLAQK